MENMVEKANEYLKNANKDLKAKNAYFYDVPTGWMNDPNGCVFAFGYYHIFYQFNPYAPYAERTHWGHTITKDFIHFKDLGVAIAPDEEYDKDGCWSGSAIFDGKRIVLMYTGFSAPYQQQCIAYSYDGINFTKEKSNPVIRSKDLKDGFDVRAFRDPYLVRENGAFYSLIANKNLIDDCGQILVYKTFDFQKFEYKGILIQERYNVDPGIYECPSLARFDDLDLLIASLNFMPDIGDMHKNFASTVYYKGRVELENPKYDGDDIKLLDYGFDYYAPQNLISPDGRNILIAWRDMWEKEYFNKDSGWCGGLGLPREIKVRKNFIKTYPIREVLRSFRTVETYESDFEIKNLSPCHIDIKGDDISFELKRGCVNVLFYYDHKKKRYVLERKGNETKLNTTLVKDNSIRYYPTKTSKHSVSLFIDNSALEVYLDLGIAAFTINYYGDGDASVNVGGNIIKAKYKIFKK